MPRREPPTPALRLVASTGRLVTAKPLVVLGGLLARAGVIRALTLWPDATAPILIVGGNDQAAARWMTRTFRLETERRMAPDPATVNALRAGALIIRPGKTHLIRAAERALGRPVRDPSCAFFATGGKHPKIHCFVFEADDPEPVVVVKALAHSREREQMESEIRNLALVRDLMGGDPELLAALPPQPLWQGLEGDDLALVEPVDPLAAHTGQVEREEAMTWLRRFHAATTREVKPWGPEDQQRISDTVHFAWSRAKPESSEPVAAALARVAERIGAQDVPRCAVHGDYWVGNVAGDGKELRVYDWEFLDPDGYPFFDIWTWELAGLRSAAGEGGDLSGRLREAVARVRSELSTRGLHEDMALVTLAPSIGHLTFRIPAARGYETGNEESSARVMAAAEKLILETA